MEDEDDSNLFYFILVTLTATSACYCVSMGKYCFRQYAEVKTTERIPEL
jgi:hypothetical protein